MSENDNAEATASENTESEETPAQETEETEIDWKAQARKWEDRAKANKTEADELREPATRLEAVEKQLNELTEKHAETEKSVETAQLEATRWKVAALNGISDEEDIKLFLTASDEETLTKQAQRISQHSARAPRPDSGQGNRSGKGKLTPAEEFAEAWNSALKT